MWSTKIKHAPISHKVQLNLWDTNPVFLILKENYRLQKY